MRRASKFLIGAIIGIVVIWGCAALWSNLGAKRISATADQLRLPSGWTLQTNRIQGPKLVCIGDIACPSLSRQWHATGDISSAEFSDLFVSSSWNLEVMGSCEPQPNGQKMFRACSANGEVNGYKVKVYYENPDADNHASGTLKLFLQ